MRMKSRPPGHEVGSGVHHPVTRVLHWSVLAFILIAAGSMIARACAEESAACRFWLTVHQSAGIVVLGLTLIRLVWRRLARVGAVRDALPRAIRIGAAFGHASLYLVLLALIAAGWLTTNAFGRPLLFLGTVSLPALIGRDRNFGDDLQAWHAELAWLLLILVLAHVGAALWHHFVCRDGVLRSMTSLRRNTDSHSTNH
jgi:cytochrome b561